MCNRHASIAAYAEEAANLADNLWSETESGSDLEEMAQDVRDAIKELREALGSTSDFDICGQRREGWTCTRPADHDGMHAAGFEERTRPPVYAWGVVDDELVEYNLHPDKGPKRQVRLAQALVRHAFSA